MSADEATTGVIELGDMSKLRVLLRLRYTGQLQYAKDVADEIEGADAKAIAYYLLKRAPSSNGHATTSANGVHLTARIKSLAEKVERTWSEHNTVVNST